MLWLTSSRWPQGGAGLVRSPLCSGGCPWEEEIDRQLCLELCRKTEAMQWQWGAEWDLKLGAAGMVAVAGDECARSQPRRAHACARCCLWQLP